MSFGGTSTVWMTHDLHDKRDVALKVLSSGECAEIEIQKQDRILELVQDTSQLILVLPLKSPCVDFFVMRKMSIASRMSTAKQLLVAVENLHKAGIVYRDLNYRNCMSAKYEALGRPQKANIPYVELSKQRELVYVMEIPEHFRTEEFYLGDFGLAFKVGDSSFQTGDPPPQICSPDRLHGREPSLACDMWSYMYTGGIISGLVCYLGPLPEQWKGLYQHGGGLDSWYDQDQKPDINHGLAARLAHYHPDASEVERELVRTLLLKCSINLRDHDFQAVMETYGC
ncbi:kinase-like domain-containing protein [Aspergillus spectabilis]